MKFRGVELEQPVQVPNIWTNKVEVYFSNLLPHNVREEWAVAGFPIYWDTISKKSYIVVDPKDLEGDTTTKPRNCDFGCWVTGSMRHHHMCSAFEEDR